jgi:hypothetical protein
VWAGAPSAWHQAAENDVEREGRHVRAGRSRRSSRPDGPACASPTVRTRNPARCRWFSRSRDADRSWQLVAADLRFAFDGVLSDVNGSRRRSGCPRRVLADPGGLPLTSRAYRALSGKDGGAPQVGAGLGSAFDVCQRLRRAGAVAPIPGQNTRQAVCSQTCRREEHAGPVQVGSARWAERPTFSFLVCGDAGE